MVNNIYDPKAKTRTTTCPDNQRADVMLRQYTRDTLSEKHFAQKITQQLASFTEEQLKNISTKISENQDWQQEYLSCIIESHEEDHNTLYI